MSNLEHLIENGLCLLDEGKSYKEWHEFMQQDSNWDGNENITLDTLWEVCQYVIFVWDSERTFVQCKDCKWYDERISICDNCGLPREQTFFCADGERKEGR